MTRIRAVLLLVVFLSAVGGQDKEANPQAEKAYRQLREKFDESVVTFRKALDAAKTEKERKKVFDQLQPNPDAYAMKFMALARKYSTSRVAVDSLIWVVNHPLAPDSSQVNLRAQALTSLASDHIRDKRLGLLCTQLVHSIDVPADKFMRAVFAKAPTKATKARACASLAHNLKYRARLIRMLKEDEPARKELERIWGKATIANLSKSDPDALLGASEKLFEYVSTNYGDLPHPLHGTLANLARWHLLSIRKPITLDKASPNIIAPDVEGKKMALRDFSGKVILMDFWAMYFPPCQQMLPYERKLVRRMDGKPFVLIGVNGDGDRAEVRKMMKAEKITWRSWFDGGGTGGSIATRWEVDNWPTLVLIDSKGIVRSIYEGWPETKTLDAEIDKLVKEAQKGK